MATGLGDPFTSDPPASVSVGAVVQVARRVQIPIGGLTIPDWHEGYFENDDSFTPTEGMLLLVTQEGEAGGTGAKANGVYVVSDVTDAAVTIERSSLATAATLPGLVVEITEGAEANKRYQCTTAAPITLDTTSLTFVDMTPGVITPTSNAFSNTPPVKKSL